MDYTLTFPLKGMPGLTSGVVPVIRIYGVSEVHVALVYLLAPLRLAMLLG